MENESTDNKIQKRIHLVLDYLIKFTELSMLFSILIFCFFVLKGLISLGHIPFDGDKQVVSFKGIDGFFVILMLYGIFYGVLAWIIIMLFGYLSSFIRKKKAILIGLTLWLVNIMILFSSQIGWILG